MDLTKIVYEEFNNFEDSECDGYNGHNSDCGPTLADDIETELRLIKEQSPISLPDDYCEIFRLFGGGGIEDKRKNYIIPTMTFWGWEDIEDFAEMSDFFETCPNALPFGDDIGDKLYCLIQTSTGTKIYMTWKSMFWDENYRHEIAESFTELFTNPEAQRKFRNLYKFGEDKGGDGR